MNPHLDGLSDLEMDVEYSVARAEWKRAAIRLDEAIAEKTRRLVRERVGLKKDIQSVEGTQ